MRTLEPLKATIVIKELKKIDDDHDSQKIKTYDERGYPRVDMENIEKYYKENNCKLNWAGSNFAIVSGSLDGEFNQVKTMVFDITNYNIKEIIAGESFVIFQTCDGVCFFLANDNHSWFDYLKIEKNSETAFPIPFTLSDPVERVVAREDCLFITQSGAIHLWRSVGSFLEVYGSNFENEKIIDVALGDGHALFLSESGQLFGYGTNKRIVRVFATYNTSLVLTEAGSVYSCGDSSYGAHGHTSTESWERRVLSKIIIPEKIVDIHTGLFFAAVKTNLENYYVFGYNNMGQFGRSSTITERIDGPHYMDTFQQENIERLSCGSYHSMIITKDKRVYISGWDIRQSCFPSSEMKYHYIDISTILGSSTTPTLPSNIDIFASTGLHYLVIYSLTNTTNCFNYRKSYKICDITFKLKSGISIDEYPTFMLNDYPED